LSEKKAGRLFPRGKRKSGCSKEWYLLLGCKSKEIGGMQQFFAGKIDGELPRTALAVFMPFECKRKTRRLGTDNANPGGYPKAELPRWYPIGDQGRGYGRK
jgi:hypothetical protein